MAAKVHFKVYVYSAANDKPEVRRLILEKHFLTRFSHLNFMLQDICPDLKTKTYSVAWKDEDGDEVVVSSDADMTTALEVWGGDVIKLFVYCKPGAQNNTVATVDDKSLVVHRGVICDVCEGSVVGFRYKCSVCDDYDLCSRCEAAGHHPHHSMTRISKPRSTRTQREVAVREPQSMQLPANFRGSTSSTSVGLRVGMPGALNLEFALNNEERRFNM